MCAIPLSAWKTESANYAPRPLQRKTPDQLTPVLVELRAALHGQDSLVKELIAERIRMLQSKLT
jgi:hypothetical protein